VNLGVLCHLQGTWACFEQQALYLDGINYCGGRLLRKSSMASNDGWPQRVTFKIKLPLVAELHYDCCAMISRHNRCRQEDMMLELKFVTRDWSVRVEHSLLGMIIVHSLLLYVEECGELSLCSSESSTRPFTWS
jgi:hypothetical protein